MGRTSRLFAALVAGLLGIAAPAAAAPTSVAAANDPVFAAGLQWGLELIGAPQVWDRATGTGIRIAVVDSGVDLGHEDLKDQVAGQVSCIGANGDPRHCSGSAQDDNGHGTHVAGIALAATDNGKGMAGVAPDAELLAVRALANQCNSSGCSASGTAADVTAGIRWAVQNDADVINLSLGGGTLQGLGSCGFCDAIEEAWEAGVIVVVAAGNDSFLPSGFGEDQHAVVVTATTREDTKASYSNTSGGLLSRARWAVAAPGGEGEADPADCNVGGSPQGILSAYVGEMANAYACMAGTSMAAPHVSGALALLLSTGMAPETAVEHLLATAEDLGATGRDSRFGSGRVDLVEALASAPMTTQRPATTTTAPTTSTLAPSSSTAATAPPSTTAPTTTSPTTAPAPPVAPPDTSVALPFTGEPEDAAEVPPWLIGVAAAAILATGAAATGTAWRLRSR